MRAVSPKQRCPALWYNIILVLPFLHEPMVNNELQLYEKNQSIKVLFPQHAQSLTIYKYWHNSGKRHMQLNE